MKRLASVYQAEVDKRRQLIPVVPESLTPLAQNSFDNPQLNQGLDFLNDSLGFSGEWQALREDVKPKARPLRFYTEVHSGEVKIVGCFWFGRLKYLLQ